MVYLSFNQFTALVGVIYAMVLLYYYWRLQCVWEREAERSVYGVIIFTGLFLISVLSFVFIFITLKTKGELEQKAASIIQKELERPAITAKPPRLVGRLAKMTSAFLLCFMAFHSVMRKT